MSKKQQEIRERRRRRTRSRITGTAARPRLCVRRSVLFTYASLIDDDSGTTIISEDTRTSTPGKTKTEHARTLGETLARRAIEKGITTVVFDRGSSKYHGRVRAVAEGARSAGLLF